MKPRFRTIYLGSAFVLLCLIGVLAFTGWIEKAEAKPIPDIEGVCPPVQNTPLFTIAYGDVTIDGSPAPVGAVVEARSPRGHTVGCFVVHTQGSYGFMYVYGEDNSVNPPIPGMRSGEQVAFYVNGSPATATPSLTWSNDKTWHEIDVDGLSVPVAEFSGTPTSGPASLGVTFTNLSSGDYTTCSWTFGDGDTSSSCGNPTHTYDTPGSYTVSLTVTGPLGSDTETKTDYITVYTPVSADFSGTPRSGPASLAVDFTNLSSGDYVTCAWDFGDGGTSTSCSNPSHTYTTAGTYTVSLTASGPGGSDTETKISYITVYEPPVADFSGAPTSGPAALTVDFTNLSTGDYATCAWDFGDGGASSHCNPPDYTYDDPGVYAVSLTVSGLGGSDTETKTGYITVYEPVDAAFSGTPTSGPAALTVAFTNLSTGDYATCTWDFGDGGASSSCAPPDYSYDDPGTYSVSLTVAGPGGADTETKTDYITVYEPPVADFSGAPTSGPAALTVDFTNLSTGDYDTCAWTFGDGGASSQCAPTDHTYDIPGTYTVALTVSGLGGSDTETKTGYITVYEPVDAAFSGAPRSGPAALTVDFTNLSSGDYVTCAWDFGDGGTSTSCSNPSHTYTTAGTYTVSLTVSGPGGSDTETKTSYITVYEPVDAEFNGTPLSGPAALTVAFTNLSTGDYATCAWTFGDGGASSQCAPTDHTYDIPGTYTVALTVSGLGGSDTETKTGYITVYEPPVADFSGAPTSGPAALTVDFMNLSTGDFDICEWTFGDGGASSECEPSHYSYDDPGIYTVSLTVSGLGGSDTETKTSYITVYEPPVANFSGAPTSGPAALTVDFMNLSTGDFDICEWTFGDGGASSHCNPPDYTYDAPGVYAVSLSVSGLGGSDTETKTGYITVYEPVDAAFSGAPTSGPAPLAVVFTHLSTGDYATCAWTFGDGGASSNCTPPAHTYHNPGVYTVTLMVSGLGGTDTETKTHYITVYEPPVADFSGMPVEGAAPHLVHFTNLSTGDYATCAWTFGDGGAHSACTDPNHTYNAAGVYTVTLAVSGLGGADAITRSTYITVHTAANAAFSAAPTSGPATLNVAFTNLSTGDYATCAWDFGDGGASSSCAPPDYSYDDPGTYSVSLMVAGPGGADTETKTDYITVYEPPVADFSGAPVEGVAPHLVHFTNLSTGDYATCAWTFGDGGAHSACTDPNHTYNAAGVYTVTLAVSGLGGADAITRSTYITVHTAANAAFSAAPTSGPATLNVAFTNLSTGDYATCTWDFGDGGASSSCAPPDYSYDDPGTYSVSLTVAGLGGEDTETKTDYITVYEPPVADFSGAPTSGPAALTVDFTNLSTGDYGTCAWDFGDGGASSHCNPPDYTYDDPGIYAVSLTVSGLGGSDTETKTGYITVYEPVDAAFSGAPTSGIAELDVTFTNQSSGDYTTCMWDFGDGATSTDCADQEHTYVNPGQYTVSLTIEGPGGQDQRIRSNYITVYGEVIAGFEADPTSGAVPLEVQFTNLSQGNFTSCTWVFGDGGTSTDCGNPSHSYETAGIFTVILSVSGPGGNDTETKMNYITVYAQPVADFSATPTAGPASLDVAFTNLTTGVVDTCLWNFGDGGTSTVCDDPEHTYTTPGSYTVILLVTGPGGTHSKTRTSYITVYAPVTAAFTAAPTTGVAPLAVQFTNSSSGDYATCHWDFGDGGSSDQCGNPSHTYANEGTYTVALTVSGTGGSDTETKTDHIEVYGPVHADFSATPTSGQSPLLVTFTNLSIGDFDTCAWNFGDGGTSTECAPTYTYTVEGTYTVSLTVSGTGGADAEVKTDYIIVRDEVYIFLPLLIDLSNAGLIMHFEEPVGSTTFLDASGHGNNGTCSGAACPTAGIDGPVGLALRFDGEDDVIGLGNPPSMNREGEITLEAWVRVEATDGIRNIIAHGYTAAPKAEVFLRIWDGFYQVGSWDGNSQKAVYPVPANDIGQWVHLAGTYDGVAWRLFRNGQEVATLNNSLGAITVGGDWAIGAHANRTERFFEGDIDEVGVYFEAMSANTVMQRYSRHKMLDHLTPE